jgi:alpha-glucosidase
LKKILAKESDMNTLLRLALLLVIVTSGLHAQSNNPVADPTATVSVGQARFTILTPAMIRMEWSSSGQFEDDPSLVFINRRLPVPVFAREEKDGWLLLKTEKLTLKYRKGPGPFIADNLEVRLVVNGKEVVWKPGTEDRGNLKGTTRTLDGVEGATNLEPGLLSRDGWVVVDDSERPLFDSSDWPWVRPRPEGKKQDLYFFGYGHDYKKALHDFTLVAGKIPMPPRFAFGFWWSRYWAYTDEEFKQLVREFEIYNVPLDVLVIDMDWHLTFNMRWDKEEKDQAGQTLGWTGYTWDRNYFPDPKGFLDWCDTRGLKTPLNLHPASGIQPHEDQYPAMARAMGMDPSKKQYVPFDIVDKKFATNYFDLVIHPLEKQGIDFWWLDWQQWGTTKIPGVTPTWWLNYVFFTDMGRAAHARPLLFHRWGGLGNHRYQIGFSGDVISVWQSLKFQPYFTATASNVGFGYWSHDIGGHMPGTITPELYTRWIQWGAFSPIIRTHTTKNPGSERRIWAYPTDAFLAMRDAVRLRYGLIPYIYTMARHAYETGEAICRPMYYDYPEASEAYEFTGQYMFGDQMLVAPIVGPVDSVTMLASVRLWVPPGEWVEWFTGAKLTGPQVVERQFAVDDIPVYLKAGAIIPMQPEMKNTGEKPVDPLIITVVPGPESEFSLYEDAGNSIGYQRGEFSRTGIRTLSGGSGEMIVRIGPSNGEYPGRLKFRGYEICIPGVMPPSGVTCNGLDLRFSHPAGQPGWSYNGTIGELRVRTGPIATDTKTEIVLNGITLLPPGSTGLRGKLARMRRVMPLLNNLWPKEWSPELLVTLAQTGNRLSVWPEKAQSEITGLKDKLPDLINEIRRLSIDEGVKAKVLGHLRGIEK